MSDPTAELLLAIEAPGLDANELEDLTRQLRDEIDASVDVAGVERVPAGPIPEGAMGADWAAVGELAVKLAPILVPPLIAALHAWIDRQYKGSRRDDIKLDLKIGKVRLKLDRSTSRQEQANMEKLLQDEAQKQ